MRPLVRELQRNEFLTRHDGKRLRGAREQDPHGLVAQPSSYAISLFDRPDAAAGASTVVSQLLF